MKATSRKFDGFFLGAVGLFVASAGHADLAPVTAVFDLIPEIITPPPVDPGPANVVVVRSQPAAAAVGDGFVVAWRDEKSFGPSPADVMMNQIKGQLVDRSGGFGTSFLIDLPGVPGLRRFSSPVLGDLGDGRFQIAWAQDRSDGRDVFGQWFAAGVAEGEPRRLSDASSRIFGDLPSLAGGGGASALAWPEITRPVPPASRPTVRHNLLRFDVAGAPTIAPLRLGNPRWSELQVRPAVALDAAGIATVAWLEPIEGPNPLRLAQLWSQRFDAAGHAVTAKVRLATRAAEGVAIASTGDGQSVVVWVKKAQNGTLRLYASRLSAEGRLAGAARDLGPVGTFGLPVLLRDGGGSFALAWIDGERLLAVHLGADLVRRGSRVDVASARPDLDFTPAHGFGAALSGGRVLFAWEGSMPQASWCPGNAIKAQIFELR